MTALEFRTTLLKLGLSQKELAQRMGVVQSTVNRWGKGALAVPVYVETYLSQQAERAIATKELRVQAYREMDRANLARQPCEVCGATDNVDAHHEDYTKPLEVRWLCKVHHRIRHREIKLAELAIREKPASGGTLTPEEIKAIRLKQGLSVVDFCKRYGLEPSALSQWEMGRRVPQIGAMTLLRLIARDPEKIAEMVAAPV